jgi:hypothetical protein
MVKHLAMKEEGAVEVMCQTFLTSSLDDYDLSASGSRRSMSGYKVPVTDSSAITR